MAMIKCPECGKDISSYASVCINCGFPLEYKKLLNEEQQISLLDLENLLKNVKALPRISILMRELKLLDLYYVSNIANKDEKIKLYEKERNAIKVIKKTEKLIKDSRDLSTKILDTSKLIIFYNKLHDIEIEFKDIII